MRRRAIQFICLWITLVSPRPTTYAAEFAGGTGTLEDPYQIATAEQLMSIGLDRKPQTKHFALVADIDLDPDALSQAALDGSRKAVLSLSAGSLDGRGHEIRNFGGRGIDSTDSLIKSIGRDAIVRNLTLKSALMNSGEAILASSNEGLMVSCSVEGTLLGATGWGPLVASNSGTIMYCRAVVLIASGSGLVGKNTGTIVACCATWAASAESDCAGCIRGGLVTSNFAIIEHCYATGDVSAGSASAGLVGYNTGTIRQCYASGRAAQPLADGVGSGVENCCFLSAPGGGTDNGVGVPLTDAQMRRQESFVGWDFRGDRTDGPEDTWFMPPEGGFPLLVALDMPTSGGSGTADDPYVIESADQFLSVPRDLLAHYRLAADIDFQGRSFSSPMIPLFQGSFDGTGHAVANFVLTDVGNSSVFGILGLQATVTNLNLQRVRIVAGGGPTGTLAARNRGKVAGCTANVIISTAKMGDSIGGLIGANEGGEVRQCSVRCGLAGTGNLSYCGGLIGDNSGLIVECHGLCFANGNLFASGALVGRNSGTITDCYAGGHLNSHHYVRGPTSPFMGGLVGWNTGSITNCYASTTIDSSPISGGLAGWRPEGSITNSYFLLRTDGGGPDNGLGTSLTNAQMRQQASFVGWDFAGETANGSGDIWRIDEGKDYPRLSWETAGDPNTATGK